MLQVIDRRLAGKNKSITNRERFLRRFKNQIKESVADAIRDRSIRDVANAESISIPRKDITEPTFHHGQGGVRDAVHPGNQEYIAGDKIKRPQGGRGGGGSQASNEGEGQDDFVFELSREEFMNFFFEDLELPRLARTQTMSISEFKTVRSGFSSDGSPTNLHVVRSLRNAIGRRIALASPLVTQLKELEKKLAEMRDHPDDHRTQIRDLEEEIHHLRARVLRIPYLDPTDLRFVNRTKFPQPCTQAVMFCLMDVSGSMDQARKDLAKRFFILLYLFLTRNYDRIDIVFIRHHTQADEVDEDTFFHSQESGGTVVSSALELMNKIVTERYPPREWNIYGAQASDGDNWNNDSPKCRALLHEKLLPLVRYFAYIQVTEEEQNLWQEYEKLLETDRHFAMKKVSAPRDIYPVFRELFKKQEKV